MNNPPEGLVSATDRPGPTTDMRASPNRLSREIFIGPHGPRSGWRFAIYLACFLAVLFLLSFVVKLLLPHRPHAVPAMWGFLIGESEFLVSAMLPAVALARFERSPFGAYGLPRQGAFGKQFWIGALWGIVAITVLLLVMRGSGAFYFGGLALHGARMLKFALFWGVLFLMVGFAEEFLFRGYSLFTLAQGMGFWPAALLLSAVFGAVHLGNQGEAWIGGVAAACIALFFCLTIRRTGALWFAVGMHASWDWGESFLYSVPDSGAVVPGHLLNSSFHGSPWLTGGTVGPEGSVLVFVLIALMWVVFDRVYPARDGSQSHRDAAKSETGMSQPSN
jgi:membrane protease YdiL (CAAX protease family)